MVSIRIPRAEAWIQHPQIPDLRVLVEEPSRAEFGKRQYELGKHRGAPVAILHPDTREIIRDADGKVATETPQIHVNAEEVDSFLGSVIKQVQGIDEADARIGEILVAFGERPYDVTDEKTNIRKPFKVYLFEKVMTEATFERPDPLASTSATQLINA